MQRDTNKCRAVRREGDDDVGRENEWSGRKGMGEEGKYRYLGWSVRVCFTAFLATD